MKTINYKYNKLKVYVNRWGNLVFEVYKKLELSSPWYRKSISFRGKYGDIRKIPGYYEALDSLKKNILPIKDLDSRDMSEIEDYGIANCWTKETKTPRLDKHNEDLRTNKYLCTLSWEESIGSCYKIYVNWTYKYKYSCDSSD